MEKEEYQIRLADESDREILYQFHRALYIDYRKEIIPSEYEELYAYKDFDRVLSDDICALLRDNNCRVWVAENADHTIGYLTGRIEHQRSRLLPKRGIVEDWWVDKHYRGAGVGKKLFETAVAFFRQHKCDVIDSGTWALNEKARKLHRELGFHEVEVKFRLKL